VFDLHPNKAKHPSKSLETHDQFSKHSICAAWPSHTSALHQVKQGEVTEEEDAHHYTYPYPMIKFISCVIQKVVPLPASACLLLDTNKERKTHFL